MNLYRSVKKQEGGGTGGTDVYIDGVKSSASRIDLTEMISSYFQVNNNASNGAFKACVYNDEIHMIGHSYHYKLLNNNWVSVDTIPVDLRTGSNLKVVVFNNCIHCFRTTSTTSQPPLHYKWDGTTWSEASTLPYSGDGGIFIVYNNAIHLIGGGSSADDLKKHYKWDGTNWSSVSTLPFNSGNNNAIVYKNAIHVVCSGAEGYRDIHYKWDGTNWSSVSTVPYEAYSELLATDGDNLYLIGGATITTGKEDNDYHYLIWDGTNWSSRFSYPFLTHLWYCSVLNWNNGIYILGTSNYNANKLTPFPLNIKILKVTS